MNYILFDGSVRNQLLPFTFTRPVADIRFGILSMRERWEYILGSTTSTITEDYLSEKWPLIEFEENIMINAAYFPSSAFIDQVKNLQKNEAIFDGEEIVAFYTEEDQDVDFSVYKQFEIAGDVLKLEHTWDIFSKNDIAIKFDFELILLIF